MCALSQFEISDLARMVHAGERGHKIVAVLQFKFDESYDDQFMTIGGWLAEENEWQKLERGWDREIDRQNKKHMPNQQITKFHAVEMNGLRDEYKNWDADMSRGFVVKLISLIDKRKIGGVAIGADMKALDRAFPERPAQLRKDYAYVLCIKAAMVEIAHLMKQHRPGDTVHLVHEHGNWDAAALKGYNLMVDDKRWDKRSLFEGITPLTKTQSIGLQAADMIAFESHKALRKKILHNDSTLRKAVKAMVKKRIPIMAKHIGDNAAMGLRKIMEESGRYQPDQL